MDVKIEELIVRSFVTKRFQDRFLFELSSKRKRVNALNRLCHNYTQLFRDREMVEIPKKDDLQQYIHHSLTVYGAGSSCYVISFNSELDGRNVP
ncbi:hypothetical protein [Marininema halotolerans]|uniref:Uncharacterized protein n=1 Tax=Marininema halotolerans TaxID=1155944 RepID=A0A1I6RH66_9BACL|nr:hypothetical protein [Marininema halotolerans]SFS64073.1 hypothetical protein SAMN05444972_10591 [Marininema halotolerans]